MKGARMRCLMILALLVSNGLAGEERIYKSIDDEGRVTYSSEPVQDAVQSHQLEPAPAPADHAIEDSRVQAQSLRERADEVYRALMEQREQRRAEAERLRREKEKREQERRRQELLERLSRPVPAYAPPGYWYGGRYWHGNRPWRPRPPAHRPSPPSPGPSHPQTPPPRGSEAGGRAGFPPPVRLY